MFLRFVALSLLALVGIVAANPAALREFHRAVNADGCLKQCMDAVKRTDVELSFIRRSNVSDYLLHLGQVCEIVRGARSCLQGCEVGSNPFALQSMTVMCQQPFQQVAGQLEQCMREHGAAVNEECVRECGDYEALHMQLSHMTEEVARQASPDSRAHLALHKLQANNCRMFKCSERCSVLRTSARCARLADGNDAGGALRFLIDLALVAHRRDLEQERLVQAMAAQNPAECNYLYAPEVMFDEQRDRLVVMSMEAAQRQPQPHQPPQLPQQPMQPVPVAQVQPLMVLPQAMVPPSVDPKLSEYKMQLMAKKERNLDLEALKLIRELEQIAQA